MENMTFRCTRHPSDTLEIMESRMKSSKEVIFKTDEENSVFLSLDSLSKLHQALEKHLGSNGYFINVDLEASEAIKGTVEKAWDSHLDGSNVLSREAVDAINECERLTLRLAEANRELARANQIIDKIIGGA